MDVAELRYGQANTCEDAFTMMELLINSGAMDLICVDSVAALTPRAEVEGEFGSSQVSYLPNHCMPGHCDKSQCKQCMWATEPACYSKVPTRSSDVVGLSYAIAARQRLAVLSHILPTLLAHGFTAVSQGGAAADGSACTPHEPGLAQTHWPLRQEELHPHLPQSDSAQGTHTDTPAFRHSPVPIRAPA